MTEKTEEELEIIQYLKDRFAYSRENLKEMSDIHSKHGQIEFQSHGGLMDKVMPHPVRIQYEYFHVDVKHIEAVSLAPGVVGAMYYSTGSCKVTNGPTLSNLGIRATEIFVKEDGKWKGRIGHWSPLNGYGGLSGTFDPD